MQTCKKFNANGVEFNQIGTTDGEDNIECYLSTDSRFIATYHPNEKHILVVDTEAQPDGIPYYCMVSNGFDTIEEAMGELFTRWNVLEGEED